ncbi:MAG: tetratricopeptide repeat protein [Alphaproteobacteria bacterium]|nr:tetratricopeptide repeat protein [Alphaproteobacteria bacterium]
MADGWGAVGGVAQAGVAAWLPGLVTFAIAVSIGALFAAFWRWPMKPLRGWLFDAVNALDRAIVVYGSWGVGTRIRNRNARWAALSAILFGLGTLGAFAPGAFGFVALVLGLISILIVYRHWSWDEDDVAAEIVEEEKRIQITGNLRNEVLTAVGFLFFYYPVAFAKLQAEGVAFSYVPGSGLLALSTFTLMEFVKSLPFIGYFEIFGGGVQAESVGNAAPSLAAKVMMLGLRASFDLVLIASILRLPHIARLAQEGRDLRPIDEALASNSEERHYKAVDAARAFALRRRPRARERLIRVTEQRLSSDRLQFSASVRAHAADALVAVGSQLNDEGAMYAAASVYRQVFDDPNYVSGGLYRAKRKNDYGNIMSVLSRGRGDTLYLEEAVAAYHEAMILFRRDWLPEDWAMTQNNLGLALNKLANRTKDASKRVAAIEAFRGAIEERPREKFPLEWAKTQLNLANALCDMGEDDPSKLKEGIATYRLALEERTRERDPSGWGKTRENLGMALEDLWRKTHEDALAEEAIACFEDALKVRSPVHEPEAWADSQKYLATMLSRLGRRRRDADLLTRAVAAYRAALKKQRRDKLPLDWATTQNNLGISLTALGELRGDARLIDQAIAAYREALEERTRERAAVDWARSQDNLGNALAARGKTAGDAKAFENAIATFRAALEVRTREADPESWATTVTQVASALGHLARLRREPALRDEALALCNTVREARPADKDDAWAMTALAQARLTIDDGELRRDAAACETAAATLTQVVDFYSRAGAAFDLGEAQHELTRAQALSAKLRAG